MINYKYQRGQALSEYVVLIPAAIMIVIGASLVTGFIVTSLGKSVGALQPYGVEVCDLQPEIQPELREGPTYVQAGDHSIELSSVVYNPADDTTTIVYTVTSGPKPSISHWTLGLPQEVADNILETSEKAEDYGTDPTTSVTGVKFDTGYEVAGGGGNGGNGGGSGEDDADTGGNGNGNGNGNGKGNKKVMEVVRRYVPANEEINTVSRDVILLVSGQYDFGPIETAVKAGQDVHIVSISAPIRIYDPEMNWECAQ